MGSNPSVTTRSSHNVSQIYLALYHISCIAMNFNPNTIGEYLSTILYQKTLTHLLVVPIIFSFDEF
jgi:hypothetical protein